MRKKSLQSIMLLLLLVMGASSAFADDTYVKITSTDDLVVGEEYLFVYENASPAVYDAVMGAVASFGAKVDVSKSGTNGTIVISSTDKVNVLTLGGSSTGWTFQTSIESKFLSWSSGNSLAVAETATANSAKWTITFATDGKATVANVGTTSCILQYNTSSPRFACYTSSQAKFYIYKKQANTDPSKSDPELAYSETSVVVNFGDSYDLPSLTNLNGLTVTYASSNEDVATITTDGEVSIVGVGTTTISATFAGDETYKAGSASYTLKVNQAMPAGTKFYESFDTNSGSGGNDDSWSGSIASNDLNTDNEGWVTEKGSGADQCAKFGTGSAKGTATTPAISLTKGFYSLKFNAGAWDGKSEKTTLVLSATNATLSESSLELAKAQFNEYNINVMVAADADVTFTFAGSVAGNNRFFLDEVYVLEAENPTVTIGAAQWATYIPAFNADLTNVPAAYIVTEANDTKVTLEEVLAVPANTPVVLNGDAQDYEIMMADAEVCDDVDANLLVASDGTAVSDGTYYALSAKGGTVGFKKVKSGVTVPAGKPYVVIANASKEFVPLFGEGVATGFENIEHSALNMDGSFYSLQGIRVEKLHKGIFIQNGKKVVVK